MQVFVASDTPGLGSCLGPLEVAQVQKMQRDAGYTHALGNDCGLLPSFLTYSIYGSSLATGEEERPLHQVENA